jgi:hypothetical protein
MQIEVDFKATGPLFKAGGPRLEREINGAIKELVQMGEERLSETLRPQPAGVFLSVTEAAKNKASTGHYRRNISTEFGNLGALITDGGVVYGPWLEGIGSRNQTTRFKGYASFRRVGDWLNGKSRDVLKAYARRFVKRMNA